VALTTITISLSVASLSFGNKVAYLCRPFLGQPHYIQHWFRYGLSVIALIIYAATFFTFFFLPKHYRHQATAALLFSFPGTLTRYLLSVYLNRCLKVFPLGTLSANLLGSALLAAFFVIQSTPSPPSQNACDVLQGLMDGYCGCLTTVSTFVAELWDLKFRKACRYAIVSWVLGQAVMVLIIGSSLWTERIEKQVTCRFH